MSIIDTILDNCHRDAETGWICFLSDEQYKELKMYRNVDAMPDKTINYRGVEIDIIRGSAWINWSGKRLEFGSLEAAKLAVDFLNNKQKK